MKTSKKDLHDKLQEYKEQNTEDQSLNYQNLLYIIEKNADGVIIVDQNKKVKFINPAVENLFAKSKDEIIGHKFSFDLIPSARTQIEISREDKSTGIAEMQVTEIVWDKEAAFLVSLHDITERAKNKEQLERYTSDLKRSNDELDNFASVASHDMNAPLRKIVAYGEKLYKSLVTEIKPKEKADLEKIIDSAKKQQELLNGLLEFSRITSRAKPFERINLNLILKAVLSDLEEEIKESGAYVNSQKLPSLEADKIQMHQLFQNLISNAIKFRKKDEVAVINLRAELKNNNWIISVEDNGIGFEKKYQEKIFKQFERLHGHSKYPGNGIGLSICQRIVERHGGNIKAESELGNGSIFTMSLPDKNTKTKTISKDKVID